MLLSSSSKFHTNYHPNLIGLWRRVAFRALLTHQYTLHGLEVVRLGKLTCAMLNASSRLFLRSCYGLFHHIERNQSLPNLAVT
jgi:hypothetical protein